MADFDGNATGGMQEGTEGLGGAEGAAGMEESAQSPLATMWDSFFASDEEGQEGGEPGGEPDGGTEPEGDEPEGGQPAGGTTLPNVAGQSPAAQPPTAAMNVDAEVQRRVDAAIARQFGGMVNPYTGRPITTEAELQAYQQAFAAEELERRLREAGLDRVVLDDLIRKNPVVQQAEAMIHEQRRQQANDFVEKEFNALLQEFPDCGLKDARELMNTPEGMETLHLWQTSPISLKTAYAATHMKEIREKQSRAVRQGVMNEVNSKAHLKQTNSGSGQGGAEMPADVLDSFHIFFPELSDAECIALWKRTNGKA